ncbi:MAG: hypothetical protein ACRDIB_17585 [Ardenticatenaceae bacterium]
MSLRFVTLLLIVLAALATGCAAAAEQPALPGSELPTDSDTTLDRSLIEPFLERVPVANVISEQRDSNLNADVWQVTIEGERVTLYVFADEAGVQDAIIRMSAMHLWYDEQYVVTYDGESEALLTLMNEVFAP